MSTEITAEPAVLKNPEAARDRAKVGALAGSRAAVDYAAAHTGKNMVTTLARIGAAEGAKAAVLRPSKMTAAATDAEPAADLKVSEATSQCRRWGWSWPRDAPL